MYVSVATPVTDFLPVADVDDVFDVDVEPERLSDAAPLAVVEDVLVVDMLTACDLTPLVVASEVTLADALSFLCDTPSADTDET